MQLNPARGRKLVLVHDDTLTRRTRFMQLNPARGRKLMHEKQPLLESPKQRFMQLNPARGRKLSAITVLPPSKRTKVYAAQPREGTETYRSSEEIPSYWFRFMQLNPARGRKPHNQHQSYHKESSVYAAQPREGTETRIWPTASTHARLVVYAAQPREGTETCPTSLVSLLMHAHAVYAAQPREGTETCRYQILHP